MAQEGFSHGDSREIRRNIAPSPFMREDQTQEEIDEWAQHLTRLLKEHGITLDENSNVLEVGSGKALLAKRIAQTGANVMGLDARPRGTNGAPQVRGRIERMPFPDNSFDLVVSNGGVFSKLSYDTDIAKMIEDIARVLKPEGMYIGFLEPNIPAVPGLKEISAERDRNYSVIYRKQDRLGSS